MTEPSPDDEDPRPSSSSTPPPGSVRMPLPGDTIAARRYRERRALGVGVAAAVAAVAWVAQPVGIGIFLGMLNAFMLQPYYERLRKRSKMRSLPSLVCVGGSTLAIVIVLGGITGLFVLRGVPMTRALIESLGPEGHLRQLLDHAAAKLGPLGIHSDQITAKLRQGAAALESSAAEYAAAVASATFGGVLTLFFVVMTTHFMLRHWGSIVLRAEDMLPIHPRHTRAVFEEVRRVGRTTLLGTATTGLAQGLLATLGYVITGTPEPAFLGAATTVASLLPGVGTMLVWVPAGLYLMSTDHFGAGIVELVFGAVVVVGFSDYVLRPRLVGGDSDMPAFVTFVGLFGGIEVFGMIGLLLGPLIMSVALALLRIYALETAGRSKKEMNEPPPAPAA